MRRYSWLAKRVDQMEQANRAFYGLVEKPEACSPHIVVNKDIVRMPLSVDDITVPAIIEAIRADDPHAKVTVRLSGSFNTSSGPITVTRELTLTLDEIADVLRRRR